VYSALVRLCFAPRPAVPLGPAYTNRLRKRSAPGGDQWFVDEVFVRVIGHLRYLYRAVDQDGQVLDVLLQTRRNAKAATRFFRKLLKRQGQAPRRLVTDKLRSYRPAQRDVIPNTLHDTNQYANNRAECPHERTRERERRMRRFKSIRHAQLFLYEQVTCA
jgi:putative transposase